jgi:hypothetical protein
VLLALTAFMIGFGSDGTRTAQPADMESVSGPAPQGGPPPTSAAPAASEPSGRLQPLTAPQRRQLRALATAIDQVLDEFDTASRECSPSPQASCLDRPWAAVVAVVQWRPYDLNRIGARRRHCEPLGYAATAIHGFSLGAAQLGYGAPPEDGVSTGRLDYEALVDTLRPVPSDLRAAAASGCR